MIQIEKYIFHLEKRNSLRTTGGYSFHHGRVAKAFNIRSKVTEFSPPARSLVVKLVYYTTSSISG